jgi:type III restriction enzyme
VVAPLLLDPLNIPPEVQMKAVIPNNQGQPALIGPGKLVDVNLNPFRAGHRVQELAFQLARDLTRDYVKQPGCEAPAHTLFPQILQIMQRYLDRKVAAIPPMMIIDAFLSPYYGWIIERLVEAIRPAALSSETPEVPIYETNRGPGSTSDVDLWTSRDVREVVHSHLNYVVADTHQWEQAAAYIIDTHPAVSAFVKNAGLGFAIPYLHNGQMHDYIPDLIIRFKDAPDHYFILETKGYDPQAARRRVNAVNADGQYGQWAYTLARKVEEVRVRIEEAVAMKAPGVCDGMVY